MLDKWYAEQLILNEHIIVDNLYWKVACHTFRSVQGVPWSVFTRRLIYHLRSIYIYVYVVIHNIFTYTDIQIILKDEIFAWGGTVKVINTLNAHCFYFCRYFYCHSSLLERNNTLYSVLLRDTCHFRRKKKKKSGFHGLTF